MTKRTIRISGAALALVLLSLMMSSLACYSGQIPGVLELTPFYTPTPLPVADDDGRFGVLEVVLAPQESGRPFFNLTTDPEPLEDSLVNSKAMCEGNSAALVLYAGLEATGDVYYLVDCAGSVGWAVETRLAGPLNFSKNELAVTVAEAGAQSVSMLDDMFRPMLANPLQSCKPETIVMVSDVQAADPDTDGIKELFYRIECPTTGGPLRGWVTNVDLVGPVEINVGDSALAITSTDQSNQYQLANEPAPLTDENAVEGDCQQGDILQAEEARLVDETVFYRMTCGDAEGWVDQSRFVGPLRYRTGMSMIIYNPPIFVFEDELTASQQGAVIEVADETEGVDATDTEATDAEIVEGDGELEAHERKVVQYTPPLYLTSSPGPAILEGEGANVVGQCTSGTVTTIEDYTGLETIYYRVTCDECVETETDDDGELVCAAVETRDGWLEQQYLQGPLDFATGDTVMFKSGSKAIEATEDGIEYARIPLSLTGAASVGRFTEWSGRCPLDQGMTITDIVLEKARTSNTFTFYYQVECMGQVATTEQVVEGGVSRPEVTYNTDETELISGYVSARDVELAE